MAASNSIRVCLVEGGLCHGRMALFGRVDFSFGPCLCGLILLGHHTQMTEGLT